MLRKLVQDNIKKCLKQNNISLPENEIVDLGEQFIKECEDQGLRGGHIDKHFKYFMLGVIDERQEG